MLEVTEKRWLVALTPLATALSLALAYGASAGSSAPNPCPGNYVLRATAEEDRSVDVDLNGNGLVCVYQGSKADVAPFKDDRVK